MLGINIKYANLKREPSFRNCTSSFNTNEGGILLAERSRSWTALKDRTKDAIKRPSRCKNIIVFHLYSQFSISSFHTLPWKNNHVWIRKQLFTMLVSRVNKGTFKTEEEPLQSWILDFHQVCLATSQLVWWCKEFLMPLELLRLAQPIFLHCFWEELGHH